ncbi:MAG: hypothetical protein JJ979_02510 [Roseibium sp.]|nr:hypothetical protein [Roseibium sp.]
MSKTATDTAMSFTDALNEVSEKQAKAMAKKIATAIDERADFEEKAQPDNFEKNMKPKLNGVRNKLANTRAARVLIATGTDESFINRSVNDGKRHNIYALQKVADAVDLLAADALPEKSNMINRTIIRSLFRLQKAGHAMTFELAKACCSKNYRPKEGVDPKALKHIDRYTVSPATVSTQSSSTMSALVTLGLVERSGGRRNTSFNILANAATEKLANMMQVA